MKRNLLFLMTLLLGFPSYALAEPHEVSSRDLKKISVRENRAPGRLIIYANYTTHRVLLDDAEIPSYLSDIGVEVTSNELHRVKVIADDKERLYKVSVEPGQTMALYVDFGAKKSAARQDGKKDDKASKGFLTVTTETEAQVYVDGKLVTAKSPLTKQQMDSGSHKVRVYFLDTKKFSKSRDVYVGRDASMSIHFAKE